MTFEEWWDNNFDAEVNSMPTKDVWKWVWNAAMEYRDKTQREEMEYAMSVEREHCAEEVEDLLDYLVCILAVANTQEDVERLAKEALAGRRNGAK